MTNESMVTVKVKDYGKDNYQEFEVLSRKALEDKILNTVDIYKRTFDQAYGMELSGRAYTYINARSGEIETSFIQQNNFLHPFDSYYEIVLCSIQTGTQGIDLNSPDMLLSTEEQIEYLDSDFEGDAEEYILEKYGEEDLKERQENIIDEMAFEFNLDMEEITEQLNELYYNNE